MTFTATPQPSNVPPRVRIDIDSDDPSKPFVTLAIKRDGKLLREQPFIGSSTAVLYDYEAPFGIPVSYSVFGTTTTTAVTYSTAWPNLTGWTTVSGSPSVSGGRFVSSLIAASVKRSATLPTTGRLTLTEPMSPGAGSSTASLTLAPGLQVSKTGGGGPAVKRYVTFAGTVQQVNHTSGPMTIQWGSGSATVTTSEGSWTIPGTFDGSGAEIQAVVSGGSVPGFSIENLGVAVPFSASATATLSAAQTWLIHPSQPSLSCPINSDPGSAGVRFIEASSGESKSSKAQSTVHQLVGRGRPVVITSGPRQADEWTLTVESTTIAAKNALRALVNDQTPLLLRSPASSTMDLPDDWYSVGDVTTTRVEVPVITKTTLMTLPLTPVDEPIVRVGALWSWGDVLTTYSTWQDVLNANTTWLDVLAGPNP